MSLERVIEIQQKLKDKETALFDIIYKKVSEKIYQAANMKYKYCTFTIPRIIVGHPLIPLEKAHNYIFDKLTREGFNVYRFNEQDLLITWNPDKPKKSNVQLESQTEDIAVILGKLRNKN